VIDFDDIYKQAQKDVADSAKKLFPNPDLQSHGVEFDIEKNKVKLVKVKKDEKPTKGRDDK